MRFERAKSVGELGERRVAEELARLAPRYGMHVINDVLLKVGSMTAQLDHVVVDRFGVLILESKVRRGAYIKGNHVEKKWTACYGRGKNKAFQNPLAQNREHENALLQALGTVGKPLSPDYVKSAVVFVGADLSGLQLDALARARVIDVSALAHLIETRHAFALNPGDLDEGDIREIAGLIAGLDRSRDPEVVEQHASYWRRRPARSFSTDEVAGPLRSPLQEAPMGSARDGGDGSSPGLVVRVAAVAAILVLLSWAFVVSGGASLFRSQQEGTAGSVREPSTFQAKAALQGAAPEIYAALTDPDNPKVSRSSRGITFTWEYLRTSGSRVFVKTVSVTLAPDGHVVGVSIP